MLINSTITEFHTMLNSHKSRNGGIYEGVKSLNILWGFVSIVYYHHLLGTVYEQKSCQILASSSFSTITTWAYLDTVYGQSSNHWQRLLVSSYRGGFLFYHAPLQTERISTVGVSSETTPMGTIIHTHCLRTRVNSY